ncbi:amidohydrolase family protein [Kineobactrum salinum]|uniref:Amidohydrolase family protein n=1 Tax=Kineobactrum salinum TaxID=2708301 RepID=A0A6C0TXN4_9GAMM|nr:amidohydrolase family protein [Kineobactrum salinum]QIB64536.1 amidohydrolase family protein [Kineobactrum salinum]
MKAARYPIVLLALLLVATIANARSAPNDRESWYRQGSATSDDVQRVPVPPGHNAPDTVLVLEGGRIFDGTGAPARPATVVVEGKTIAAILAPGERNWPASARYIDASGLTVLPGLIDLHTHLSYVQQFGLPAPLSAESVADATLRGLQRMHHFLLSGITSVRDLASHGEVPFVLKRWQADGRIAGPRVFPAGQLITGRGGHGTEGFGLRSYPEHAQAPVWEASGPDEWRDAVRAQFKRGADVIKLGSHYSQAEITAAVAEAHALGLPVTVDAETQYIDMAIAAGVDVIEHPLPRSDAALNAMAQQDIAAVPTLVPYQYIIRHSGGYYGSTSRRFSLTEDSILDMTRAMKRAGIRIGVGTDLIVDWSSYLPTAYIEELDNLVQAGFTVAEALQAATRISADILHMGDRLGTLEVGKLADIVLVAGEPDRQLRDLAAVHAVIVNGRLLVTDGRLRSEPLQPALPPQPSP